MSALGPLRDQIGQHLARYEYMPYALAALLERPFRASVQKKKSKSSSGATNNKWGTYPDGPSVPLTRFRGGTLWIDVIFSVFRRSPR
jgi:hypothetical protein